MCLLNEPYKTHLRSRDVSCHPQATGMYQQHHHHWANSSCYCVDGEPKAGDAILSSRPDALLANGGAFILPSPALPPATSASSIMLPHYYSQPPAGIVPPPMAAMASQLHAITPTSSSCMAMALSTGDREEEQRLGVAATSRYSAEERRERIDKYRSKRNQRNFQKKITYACRKTLADSRPRVKGRFARNGGDYTEADAVAVADHHVHVPAAAAAPEWWPALHEEQGINLAAELCADDDEMLAAYLGVSSINDQPS